MNFLCEMMRLILIYRIKVEVYLINNNLGEKWEKFLLIILGVV